MKFIPIENENLGLNNDNHETNETIHEFVMSKPICDVDFLQGDQLTKIVLFHEKDRASLFNNLEECVFFKDDLDYEMEEYDSKIDSMPEIELEFLMLEKFTTNTQMAESHISLCLPMDQQPSILSNQNERSTCIFVGFQNRVTFQIFKDPYTNLLQPYGKMNFLVFMDHEYIFSGNLELPRFFLFYLLKESTSRIQVSRHLMDWLHWRDHYT